MGNLFDLSGRVAVVFGATSGIGKTLAKGLAEQGATVIPTGRRREKLEEVCVEVKSCVVQTADVTLRSSIDALRDVVLERFARVDILVNAAGITSRKPSADFSETEWSAVMDSNLNGTLRTCQSFHAALKASGRGRVINIASLGSYVAFHEVAAYCASKTAVLSLTRSLGCEWARDGISVNAIVPGVFPTELNRNLIMGTARGHELLMRTPMGRFGESQELIGVAVLLASDGASFITGQHIAVDGGFLASGVNT